MPELALSKVRIIGCAIDIPGLNVVYSLSLYCSFATLRIIATDGHDVERGVGRFGENPIV